MVDVNNKPIEESNFLCITGCKVKNDNGIYVVNKQYENGEYCLYKVKQDGTEAKTKYNIYFLNDRSDKDKTVKIVSKEELKNAAKEVKDYLNGVTGNEVVYSFSVSGSQTVEQGKYLHIKKAILLNGHINQFCGNYEIEKVYDNGGVFLHLMGKRGEKVASNANGYYQFTPISLKFSGETIKQLFEEGYIEILERSSTTKAEIKTESKEVKTTSEEKQNPEEENAEETKSATETTEPSIEDAAEHIGTNTEEATNENEVSIKKVSPVYYSINEEAARTSQAMWSFYEYRTGSATASYKNKVDEVYALADKVAETKPESAERAYNLAARFSKKYANHINTGFQIEMMCPSVMISGGSNFPVRKKEKQNARRDKHCEEYNYIMGIPAKIESILNGRDIIKSNDENAVDRLQEKIFTLTEELEQSKEMNKYYRKNNTMKDFDGLSDEKAAELDKIIQNTWYKAPFAPFELTSIRNKIKAADDRIKEIQRLKETASASNDNEQDKYENQFCKVVENSDNMRIQLFFEGKPEQDVRSLLKSSGFRWAPSEGAWQRQLTANGRYATKQLIKKLSEKQHKTTSL